MCTMEHHRVWQFSCVDRLERVVHTNCAVITGKQQLRLNVLCDSCLS